MKRVKRLPFTELAATSSPACPTPDHGGPGEGGSQVTPHSVRPTTLTPALIAQIRTRVCAGAPLETAVLAAGVTRLTLHLWFRTAQAALDRKPSSSDSSPLSAQESLCVDFFATMAQAEAEADAECRAAIAKAAKTDWRAAAWCLDEGERRSQASHEAGDQNSKSNGQHGRRRKPRNLPFGRN